MHGVDIARMVQTHVTGGGVGAALVLTSQCDSPTRGTSRDLGDYLSIFCGSHHPPITMYLPIPRKVEARKLSLRCVLGKLALLAKRAEC